MDDWLRISTSLTSEPLPCSAPRLFVSRINRTGWLRVKDQCYVVGGKRTLAIPYLSIVRKKRGGGGDRLSAALSCSFYTKLRVIPLTFTHSRSGNILSSTKQCWEAERLRQREGVGLGSGGRERLSSDFRGHSLHNKGSCLCSNTSEY